MAQFSQLIDFLNLKQNDPIFFNSYSLIKIEEAWNKINAESPTTTSTKIGIIDSGVDASNGIHPEFKNVNLGNTPPSALRDSGLVPVGGHGTQVVGIIGANNISATSSANYDLPQMNGVLSGIDGLDYTLEVRRPSFIGNSPVSFSVASQIEKLAQENASIINISIGSTKPLISDLATPWFSQAFEILSNVFFVVSAGNFEFDLFGLIGGGINAELITPANLGNNFGNVLTVGALDSGGNNRAGFSNFGSAVGIAAPGELVYTSSPRGNGNAPVVDPEAPNYQFDFSGTSASAPMVTGVAGLIKAVNPNLTPVEIKQILIQTADPITTDQPIGGRLNALEAVCHPDVLDCAPPVPSISCPFSGSITSDARIPISESPCVIDQVTIAAGDTLTVDPGVIVKFKFNNSRIIAGGTLNANGTASDPVIITVLGGMV